MKNNKDPRYTTTLHNHKDVSDNGKPLISNAEYKLLSESLNLEEYAAAKAIYSFEPKAEKMLTDKLFGRIV